MPLAEQKIAFNKIIAKNIDDLMTEHGYTDTSLSAACMNKGVDVSQSSIRGYIRFPEKHTMSPLIVKTICEIFGVTFNDIAYDSSQEIDNDDNGIDDIFEYRYIVNSFCKENGFEHDPKEFEGILTTYNCYFYPTSPGDSPIIGSLIFEKCHKICKAFLKLDTNSFDEQRKKEKFIKEYSGFVVVSTKMNCVYCILKSTRLGELCVLSFRYKQLHGKTLQCRLAEVLTISAGAIKNCPTSQRMLICKKTDSLNEFDYKRIFPHLKMVGTHYVITENDMNHIAEMSEEYSRMIKKIKKHCDEEKGKGGNYCSLTYRFAEVFLIAISTSLDDQSEFMSTIKEYSIAEYNDRINKFSDDLARDYLLSNNIFD